MINATSRRSAVVTVRREDYVKCLCFINQTYQTDLLSCQRLRLVSDTEGYEGSVVPTGSAETAPTSPARWSHRRPSPMTQTNG
jgi:hypothetical protein